MGKKNKNHFDAIGHLWITPTLEHTRTGIPFIQFRLSIESGYGKSTRTDNIRFIARNDLALTYAPLLRKGLDLQVTGRLRTRNYATTVTGQVVQECHVQATTITIL